MRLSRLFTSNSSNPSLRRSPGGRTGASMIRLLVLLLLLLAVGIFGFVRRPDLVRQYLGIEAPAWDTRQALTFANEELFKVASALAIAEVSFLDTDQDTVVAMAETGGFVEGLTQQELLNEPAKSAAILGRQIGQIERDAKRAVAKLTPDHFKSAGDQSLSWKTLSLAEQVGRALTSLDSTPLGKALDKAGAPSRITTTIQALESIQSKTAPPRKKVPGPTGESETPSTGSKAAKSDEPTKAGGGTSSEGSEEADAGETTEKKSSGDMKTD